MTKKRRALSANDKASIRAASREQVETALSELTSFFPRDRWLAAANVYRRNAVARIRNDVVTRKRPPVARDMRHYVAASTVTHCADAWTFLGRAIDCLMRGDVNTARHLAYYAELRATLSLLASEGIAIFDKYHYTIRPDGGCVRLVDRGTHNEAWLVLDYWMGLLRAGGLLGAVVAPGGIPVIDLLSQFGSDALTVNLVLNQWLKQWGLDLYRMHRDRAARNYVSYRPTALSPELCTSNISDNVVMVQDLWRLSEPQETPFEELDRALLLLGTLELFKSFHAPDIPATHPHEYERRVSHMLEHVLLPSDVWGKSIERYLCAAATSGHVPRLLCEASGSLGVTVPGQHLQVVGRSLLLLRLATGSCSLLAREAGVSKEEIKFWWQPLGKDRGLWSGDFDQDFTDLWQDVEAPLAELDDWLIGATCTTSSLRTFDGEQSEPPFGVLGGCERLMLWGLAL